jgi:putative ABC transport system substrate-binding protein
MKRREFVTLLGAAAAAWPLEASAQARPTYLVGVLAQDLQPGLLEAFRDELRKLRYVEGKDIGIEVRNAAGKSEQLSRFGE